MSDLILIVAGLMIVFVVLVMVSIPILDKYEQKGCSYCSKGNKPKPLITAKDMTETFDILISNNRLIIDDEWIRAPKAIIMFCPKCARKL